MAGYLQKKNWLMRYRECGQDMEDLQLEYKQLQALLKQQENDVSMCDVGTKKKRKEKNDERLYEVQARIAYCQRRMLEINDEIALAINRLKDAQQRSVLLSIYLGGATFEVVAHELHRGKNWVKSRHDAALELLEIPEK